MRRRRWATNAANARRRARIGGVGVERASRRSPAARYAHQRCAGAVNGADRQPESGTAKRRQRSTLSVGSWRKRLTGAPRRRAKIAPQSHFAPRGGARRSMAGARTRVDARAINSTRATQWPSRSISRLHETAFVCRSHCNRLRAASEPATGARSKSSDLCAASVAIPVGQGAWLPLPLSGGGDDALPTSACALRRRQRQGIGKRPIGAGSIPVSRPRVLDRCHRPDPATTASGRVPSVEDP